MNDMISILDGLNKHMLQNIGDELRTPLDIIIGYSTLLQDAMAENGNQLWLNDIRKIDAAAKHLNGLIEDLLQVSVVEIDHRVLEIENVPILDLVQRSIRNVISKYPHKKDMLQTMHHYDNGYLKTNSKCLNIILTKILDNAFKFTNNGSISFDTTKTLSGAIEFSIVDTGVGMTELQVHTFVQPFSQADSGYAQEYGGMGLGLFIVKRLCERLNYTLRIESEINTGTKITVCAPVSVH